MKRFGLIAAAVLLFLLTFGLGLSLNFPRGAVTRAIEASVNVSPLVTVALDPVRFTLLGLRSDRLTVRQKASAAPPLVTLTDVRMPFRPSLVQGATLRAVLGTDGQVSGFVAWNGREMVVDELAIRLEELPLGGILAGAALKGRVSFSGTFRQQAGRGPARLELPEGELRGRAEAVEVSNVNVAGTALPTARLQDVELKLRTGRTVQIERVDARGDLQGSVQGTITPNLERFQDSRLNLTVSAGLRPAWIQDTGTLRPILEGFFPGGRLDGTVTGTAGLPAWAPRGRR